MVFLLFSLHRCVYLRSGDAATSECAQEMWRMEMDEAAFPGGCAVVLFKIKTGYILLSGMFVGQLET